MEPASDRTQVRQLDSRAEPEGWASLLAGGGAPMAAMFAAVAGDIDRLTDRGVDRIRAAVGEYSGVSPGEHGDLWWSTKRNMQISLVCLAEQRPLAEADLVDRRILGARAAERGIPLESVMHAFRLGYIVVWDALQASAIELGPAAAQALLDAAGPMWLLLDRFASALASGHRDAGAVQAEDDRRRQLAFVSALRQWPASGDETRQLALGLGLDSGGCFLWAVFEGYGSQALDIVTLSVENLSGVLGLVVGPNLGAGDEQWLSEALLASGARHVGVGLARSGLAGARRSLLDAEQAHALAVGSDRDSSVFRADWLTVLVAQAADQLSDLLYVALDELQRNTELRQTVSVFLQENGSLAAAAKRLHLHPNTVAYRLTRLADRTGIDVRTSTGVAQSLAVLTLVARTAVRTPDRP